MFELLSQKHLPEVLRLEAQVLDSLERPDLLRRNTPEMWLRCLQPPHYALGVRVGEVLAALAVLYVVEIGDTQEDLSHLLADPRLHQLSSANYKICLVAPGHRGHGLQQHLGAELEAEARRRGISLLCSTASPYNQASIRSLIHLGYRFDSSLNKYGFERHLFYKVL